MGNAVLLGFIWKILKQDSQILVEEVLEMLSGKDIDTETETKCLLAGFNHPLYRDELSEGIQLPIPTQTH